MKAKKLTVADIPELAAQWHPTKNGDLRPEDVVARTGKEYWWLCDKGPDHEWKTRGNHRVNGRGCPCCSGRKVSITNNVAGHPVLGPEWHPTKNGDLRPEDIVAGTVKELWWQCSEGHDFKSRGNNRVNGRGCPTCKRRGKGYRANKPGWLYVIAGEEFAKVGISNFPDRRIAEHASTGVFRKEPVLLVHFDNGTLPREVEAKVKKFIATRTTKRAGPMLNGFTETFPVELLTEVLTEVDRVLSGLSTSELVAA